MAGEARKRQISTRSQAVLDLRPCYQMVGHHGLTSVFETWVDAT